MDVVGGQHLRISRRHTPRFALLGRTLCDTSGADAVQRWRDSQDPHVRHVTANFNPGVCLALAEAVGLDASDLVEAFRVGFPVVGKMETPGLYSQVTSERVSESAPPPSLADLWGNLKSAKPDKPHLMQEVWAQAQEEVGRGWLSPPAPLSDFNIFFAFQKRVFGSKL